MGGEETENTGNSEDLRDFPKSIKRYKENEIRTALANCQIGKGGAAMRFERLTGTFTKQNRIDPTAYKKENIPDRSAYSCHRYEFFLQAPFEISARCCYVMKKAPMDKYKRETGRVPITGQMASESRLRTQVWLKQGCNAFEAKKQTSNPMAFWTEQDVLLYIKTYGIEIASVYGDVVAEGEIEGQMDLGIFDEGVVKLRTTGRPRTGCMFCGFGCHLEKQSRFVSMKETHPKQYEYIMKPWREGGLGYKEVIDWINENGKLNIRY